MVVKYKQDNGFKVLLEPIDRVVSVSIGVWIKTGSRNETNKQHGYAHFVEHMLFKGTEQYSARDIANQIDRVGGQHNALTNREYTGYYINVVSDYLELAIKILADMYYNSLFNTVELEKEKNVIIEEIRMYEDTPDEFIHDLFMESMLSEHPLSHSLLGTIDGIGETSRNRLIEFYKEHYRDDNTILVIAGKFNEDEARRLLSVYFNKSIGNKILRQPEVYSSPKRIYSKHIERDLEQVHFCLGTEGIKRDDEDRWALFTLSTILGGNMSSRLWQNIREKEGICYSIYSFHSLYIDNGVFGIYCATSPKNFNKALELIVEECRDLLNNGITEEELSDSKTFIKGDLALGFESIQARMGHLARNEIMYGRYFSYDNIIEFIDSIQLADFQNITNRIFKNKKLSIVSVGKLDDAKITDLSL